MPGLEVGTAAPSFRLPSAQGADVALDDFRGRQNVIVWFTKGMACPFCRSQMSGLARGYPEIQKRGTELLQVSISGKRQAEIYGRKHKLPFPYLCDPDYRVRREWGLDVRSAGPIVYLKRYIAGARSEAPANDFGEFMPPLADTMNLLRDDDFGFFIVDKAGVVRFARAGSYVSEAGPSAIPSPGEILAELERLG